MGIVMDARVCRNFYNSNRNQCVALFLGLILWLPAFTQSAEIALIGTNQLVSRSELIFRGEVTARETVKSDSGMIYTYVEFGIEEILKGNVEADVLRLRFDGGDVGQVRLDVGSLIPGQGEHGFYFVENATKPMVNPLYGWAQGHFRITENDFVLAGNGEPITGVEAYDYWQNLEMSRGVAKGITTQSLIDVSTDRLLITSEFALRIKEIIEDIED